MNDISSTILTNEEGKAKYDTALKNLLSNKQFLSRILKRFTHEFKDASLSDIENKYIENNDIAVSGKMVGRNLTNIEGINIEDKTLNEGNVFYDIMFKASYPDYTGKYIGLYINIEIQNSYRRGYPIEKRGMYYAARRFGSQLKSITKETDYASLEKVYSVWICGYSKKSECEFPEEVRPVEVRGGCIYPVPCEEMRMGALVGTFVEVGPD